jgi:hypothetical protein
MCLQSPAASRYSQEAGTLRLVGLARRRLRGQPRAAASGEDVSEVTERTVERRLGVIRKLWSAGEGEA